MPQNSAKVQELAIHLSQQISNVFGAAYCRVVLAPGGAKMPTVSSIAAEMVEMTLPQLQSGNHVSRLNGAPNVREANVAEPFTPGAEIMARIAAAGQNAESRLRFSWPGEEMNNESGCLEIFFNAPRKFSLAEVSALLLMAEITRTMLFFARVAALPSHPAEQVAKKLQGDIFTMPFLEAKKIWIDAFEHEYLRQQMVKFFGNISKAARAARISRYTLYALLNKFQFSAQSFKRMKPQKSSLSRGATQNGRKKSEEQEAMRELFAQLS